MGVKAVRAKFADRETTARRLRRTRLLRNAEALGLRANPAG
jgi:hypothetical protein